MDQLEEHALARALRLSILEGSAWAWMVGLAETYFIAVAVHLGAGPVALGLSVALPLALGGLGPISALLILRRRPARRAFSVVAVVAQVLTLSVLALLLGLGRLSVAGLIAGICCYQISGQATGTAWSSWYGDLVPAERRGRWFGRRNRFVYLSTCLGVITGGALMQVWEPGGTAGAASGRGFALLFALAALFRTLSSVLLARSPEPAYGGVLPRAQVWEFARTERGGQALRILLLGALFHFPVYWSSPFFAPFMLSELRFDYVEFMAASLCVIVSKALFTTAWGHLIDHRSARLVFLTSMVGIALIPVPWLWVGALPLALLAQAFSGCAWSGYEVGYLSLLLENSSSKSRPFVFASQSLGNGTMQLAGVLTAGHLILPRVGGYQDMFAISIAGRLLVALSAPLVLMGLRGGPHTPWSKLGWRVFGLRPHGGFSVRPVLPSENGDETS